MLSTILMAVGFVLMAAGIADIETAWLRRFVRYPGRISIYIALAGIVLLIIGAVLQLFSP